MLELPTAEKERMGSALELEEPCPSSTLIYLSDTDF